MSKANVAIFDSGVGGLSIAKHIRDLHLPINLIYVADTAGFPYGNKTSDEIETRVHRVIKGTIEDLSPDLIVIGCNTASTVALESLRVAFPSVPFVGVVPAIKPACKLSQTKTIGVLATAGTIATNYTNTLIQEFAIDCKVHLFGSRNLATLIELMMSGHKMDLAKLRIELQHLFAMDTAGSMDVVVLACTHFPLILREIASCSPRNTTWLDSGKAIANRVEYLLKTMDLSSRRQDEETIFAITSTNQPYDLTLVEQVIGSFQLKYMPQ